MCACCCRAACSLKLEDYEYAKKDCNAVIDREVKNVKALYRRAQANTALKVQRLSSIPWQSPECAFLWGARQGS